MSVQQTNVKTLNLPCEQYQLLLGKGSLEKLADLPERCLSPEHNPPNMVVLSPGVYRWTCPTCGKSRVFTVSRISC